MTSLLGTGNTSLQSPSGGGAGGMTAAQVQTLIDQRDVYTPFTADQTMDNNRIRYLANTDGGALTFTLPSNPADGVERLIARNGNNPLNIDPNAAPVGTTVGNEVAGLILDGDEAFMRLKYEAATNDWLIINAGSTAGPGAVASGIITVNKLLDEARSNDVVMRVDDELFTGDLPANARFSVTLDFRHDGPTDADLRFEFNGPAGATMSFTTAIGEVGVTRTIGNSETVSTQGVGNVRKARAIGTLIMGATPGPLEMHWRQSATQPDPVTIFGGATLVLIPTT